MRERSPTVAYTIPYVIEQNQRGERVFDIWSRLLRGPHRLPRQRPIDDTSRT
jgi:hypothetical protein